MTAIVIFYVLLAPARAHSFRSVRMSGVALDQPEMAISPTEWSSAVGRTLPRRVSVYSFPPSSAHRANAHTIATTWAHNEYSKHRGRRHTLIFKTWSLETSGCARPCRGASSGNHLRQLFDLLRHSLKLSCFCPCAFDAPSFPGLC